MRRAAIVALCGLLSQSGCSAVVASFTSHNSRGTACMDEPALPAIDLIGGSLGALALVYTGTAEESPGWLAIPGVFMLSGIIASITVYACRHPDPNETGDGVAKHATPDAYDLPPNNVIPQEEREKDPDVRDATLEERGMTIPDYTPPPAIDPNTVPATPSVKREPEKKITCRINPLTQCPDAWSCVLTDGDNGFCRPDSETSKPNSSPPKR